MMHDINHMRKSRQQVFLANCTKLPRTGRDAALNCDSVFSTGVERGTALAKPTVVPSSRERNHQGRANERS
jgi:hypothetical protein